MILSEPVANYLGRLLDPADALVREMRDHADEEHIPVVEPPTARLLEILARATGGGRAVEIGTAIGMSTLHLARGGAHVTSFEIDELRHSAATGYIGRAGLSDRVDLRLEDATRGLATLEGPFDIAFVDGPKEGYGPHTERCIELLAPGGLLIVDNALMSGTVATGVPGGPWSADRIDTMRDLNERLVASQSLLATVTPVGDGVAIAVKL